MGKELQELVDKKLQSQYSLTPSFEKINDKDDKDESESESESE